MEVNYGRKVTVNQKKQHIGVSRIENGSIVASTSCEAQWLLHLLQDFSVLHPRPIKKICDNNSAVHIANDPVFSRTH